MKKAYTKALSKPPVSQIVLNKKQPYTTSKNPRDDDAIFEKYIRNLMENSDYPIYEESMWETKPPVEKVTPNSRGSLGGWAEAGQPINVGDTVLRRDYASDLTGLIADWNEQRKASGNRAQTFEEYLREIDKLIRADTERLSKMDLTDDKSKQPKMSMNTQRARQLEDIREHRQSGKGTAYSTKLNALQARTPEMQGFTEAQTNNILNLLRTEGANSTNNIIKKIMNKEFGDKYKDRGDILSNKTNKRIDESLQDYKHVLDNKSDLFRNEQADIENHLYSNFRELGHKKDSREQNLININKALGNQQHTHSDLIEKGNQKVRDLEASKPLVKLNNLEKAVSNVALEAGNPRSEPIAREHLAQDLEDYGVDRNAKIFKEWDNSRISDEPVFTDSLIESLPAEILESQFTMQRMNPKYQGEAYNNKKQIEKDLYGLPGEINSKTLANVAYDHALQKAPKILEGRDNDLKRAMKEQMNRIAHKYMRLNQYGSLQQIRESEKAAAKLTEQFAALKNAKFSDLINNKGIAQKNTIANNLTSLRNLGAREDDDFNNMLKKIMRTNERGTEIWRNNQGEKNKITNNQLAKLNFKNNIPSLGDRFTQNINNFHKTKAEALLDKYQSRGIFDPMKNPQSLKLDDLVNDVLFSEYDKETDNYIYNPDKDRDRDIRGSLKNYNLYEDMKDKDQIESLNRYDTNKASETRRKKDIEAEFLRKRAYETSSPKYNIKDLSPDEIYEIEQAIDSKEFDKYADLLESKGYRFSLLPKFDARTSRYHPNARNEVRNLINQFKTNK